MTNGQHIARSRHLEELANAAKRYTLREILDVTNAVAAELENISISGGISGGGGSSTDLILPTVASSVDGGFWYELTDNKPRLWLRQGNYQYRFNYDMLKFVGTVDDALVAYLTFDETTTADACDNEWTATGDVSLDTSIKKFGSSSLRIADGKYGLKTDSIIDINADKWTVDVWFYRDTADSSFHLGIENSHTYVKSGITALYDGFRVNGNNVSNCLETNKFTVGEWTHVAIVKNGSNLLLFKNGQLVETIALTGDFLTGGGIELGYVGGYQGYAAHYDNLRFFNGVALWTENFTPPTESDYA